MSTYTEDETIAIANTIFSQIGQGALMTLGTEHMAATITGEGMPALAFSAHILPMKPAGRVSRPYRMVVLVALDPSDTYRVEVYYVQDGARVVHYEAEDVYADQLAGLMMALDFDGETVLNPRYA